MKNDYREAILRRGEKLVCPHCKNTNMRKMYLELSIGAEQNLLDGKITIGKAPYDIHNTFEPIYCGKCGKIVRENY